MTSVGGEYKTHLALAAVFYVSLGDLRFRYSEPQKKNQAQRQKYSAVTAPVTFSLTSSLSTMPSLLSIGSVEKTSKMQPPIATQ
jgi:hypothetical protein